MYIVTFYSYRGGVGRTTALVNVGFELSRRGRKVLLVDFDLESPDLTSFPPLRRARGHPGIVEYVTAYRERGESPDVAEYLFEAEGQKGLLWVMPAGCEDYEAPYWEADPYGEALAGIDWQGLYDRQDGYLFFEDTREQWKHLELNYVLIDAHAGVTPALGISTRQLADAVVLFFKSRQDYGWLREAGRIEGKKRTILVNSGVVEEDDRVPLEDVEFCISFSHRLLLEEKVIVGNEGHSRLAKEYRRLTNELIAANFAQDRDGALLLLRKLLADPSKTIGGLDRKPDFSGAIEQIIGGFPDDAAILAQAACCLYGAARYGRALEVLDQAVELRPDSPELLWQRASYRRRLNLTPGAVSDFLNLLDVCDPQKRGWAPPSVQDRLNSAGNPWAAVDWRFDLPQELRDEATAHISDYSEPLLSLLGIDPYVASAVSQLRQLSPEAYEEAKRKPAVSALSSDAQAILFGERLPDDPHTLIEARNTLIGVRKWAEVVALLTPRLQSDNWPLEDALCLFMAWWGLGNEEELQRCGNKAWERSERQKTKSVSELQMMALVCWKIGLRKAADQLLDISDEKVTARAHAGIFSYWWFDLVSRRQFQEDTALLRDIFKGATISPPFLGREPASG